MVFRVLPINRRYILMPKMWFHILYHIARVIQHVVDASSTTDIDNLSFNRASLLQAHHVERRSEMVIFYVDKNNLVLCYDQ